MKVFRQKFAHSSLVHTQNWKVATPKCVNASGDVPFSSAATLPASPEKKYKYKYKEQSARPEDTETRQQQCASNYLNVYNYSVGYAMLNTVWLSVIFIAIIITIFDFNLRMTKLVKLVKCLFRVKLQ